MEFFGCPDHPSDIGNGVDSHSCNVYADEDYVLDFVPIESFGLQIQELNSAGHIILSSQIFDDGDNFAGDVVEYNSSLSTILDNYVVG